MRVFFSDFYWKEFRARLKSTLVIPSAGGNHTIYYVPNEWRKFEQRVYKIVCQNLTSFRHYVRLIKRTQLASLTVAEGIVSRPLKSLSFSELGRLWRRWDKAHFEHFLKPIWIPFIIEPGKGASLGEMTQAKIPVPLGFKGGGFGLR